MPTTGSCHSSPCEYRTISLSARPEMDSSCLMRLFPGEPSSAAIESLFVGCVPWPEETQASEAKATTEATVIIEEATSTATVAPKKKSNPRKTKGTGRRKRKPVASADEGVNNDAKEAGSLASSGGAAPVTSRRKRGRHDRADEDGGNKKGMIYTGCKHTNATDRVKGMCRPCYMKQYRANRREKEATAPTLSSSSSSMRLRPRRGV